MANSIITLKGKEKIIKARANIAPLSPIVGICFGDGGTNGGEVISPTFDAVNLTHELLRKAADVIVQASNTVFTYQCTLTSADIPNAAISEIGLYDSDGDIVAIKIFSPKIKDPDIDMKFEIDDSF